MAELKRLVIGVGNPLRKDDGIGPAVAHWLLDRVPSGVRVIEHPGDGAGLIELWEGFDQVVLIDALCSGGQAGAIQRFAVNTTPLPAGLFRYSSHAFGLAEAVEVTRALGRLPRRCLVYGIEGVRFEYGEQLSAEVAAAIEPLGRQILAELAGSG